jgi:hypothetical protein
LIDAARGERHLREETLIERDLRRPVDEGGGERREDGQRDEEEHAPQQCQPLR